MKGARNSVRGRLQRRKESLTERDLKGAGQVEGREIGKLGTG